MIAAASLLVVAGACAAGLAATAGGASPAGRAPSFVAGGATASRPAVPLHGAYFGVDPNFATGDEPAQASGQSTTLGQLQVLQGEIGRRVTIVSFYTAFMQPPPLEGMSLVAAQGSIPMVSWHCLPPDSQVAAGAYDAVIRSEAEAYKSYARPVFLRWFWEMNLSNPGGHATCLGTSNQAAEYVAAFQRIWTIFRQVGADNVAFIWAPSAAVSAPSATSFYPGNQYVDWIGFDMYDRSGKGAFATDFAATYPTYANATYGKPIMITETGAPLDGPGDGSPTQQQWIQQIQSALPTQFPDVHGVVYVDASDSVGDYIMSGTGLAAFAALGRSTYFAQVG